MKITSVGIAVQGSGLSGAARLISGLGKVFVLLTDNLRVGRSAVKVSEVKVVCKNGRKRLSFALLFVI